jgi:hypothetical protein
MQRLDSGGGFSYMLPKYIRNPNLDIGQDIRYVLNGLTVFKLFQLFFNVFHVHCVRMLHRYTGVRILVVAKGIGKAFSWQMTILQISSGLALLTVSALLTDVIMVRHTHSFRS